MYPLLRNQGLYQINRPEAATLYGIPYYGFRLDERPVVSLVQAAGNITSGTHRWKLTYVDAGGETTPGDPSKTITTDTAATGQVVIHIPEFPTGATHCNVYRTEAAGTTYKLVNAAPLAAATYEFGIYIDNIADASLGAAAPGSNTTTTPIIDPPVLETRVAALTAGADTDYLVSYFVADWRWTELGTGNNTLLFVPGAFTSDSGATYDWPYNPQNRPWVYTDTPVAAVTLPSYSTEWDGLDDLLEKAKEKYMIITIAWGKDVTGVPKYQIVCTPAGGTTLTTNTEVRADVPLEVCKLLLRTVHDIDFV